MSKDSENIDRIAQMVFAQEKELQLLRGNFKVALQQNNAVLQTLLKLSKISSDGARQASKAAESCLQAARHSSALAKETLDQSRLAVSSSTSYAKAHKAAQAAAEAAEQAAEAALSTALLAALSSALASDSMDGSFTAAERHAFLTNKLESEQAARAAAAAATAAAEAAEAAAVDGK